MRYTSIEIVQGSHPYIIFRNVATTAVAKKNNFFQHSLVEELSNGILYYKALASSFLGGVGPVHIFLIPETHSWFNFCILHVNTSSMSSNVETIIGNNTILTNIVKINLRMLDILNNIAKQI